MGKKYKISAFFPWFGCAGTFHITEAEIQQKYGDVTTIDLECQECMMKLKADVKENYGSNNT